MRFGRCTRSPDPSCRRIQRKPYLRMQNAANYDFTPEETARMHDYLLKAAFSGSTTTGIRTSRTSVRTSCESCLAHRSSTCRPSTPCSRFLSGQPAPADPGARLVAGTRQDSEIGPSTVHYYGMFVRPQQAGCARQHELGRFRQLGAGRRQPGLLSHLWGKGLCAGCERRHLDHDH